MIFHLTEVPRVCPVLAYVYNNEIILFKQWFAPLLWAIWGHVYFTSLCGCHIDQKILMDHGNYYKLCDGTDEFSLCGVGLWTFQTMRKEILVSIPHQREMDAISHVNNHCMKDRKQFIKALQIYIISPNTWRLFQSEIDRLGKDYHPVCTVSEMLDWVR